MNRTFTESSRNPLRKLILPFIIFSLLLLFLFNLRFLSRFFDWDSVIYAFNVERALRFENKGLQKNLRSVFINPHHLGFESSGYAYMKIVKKYYPEYDLMFMLRLRILISALLFLGIFFAILYALYKNFLTAFLLTLAVAFSQGFWFYSQHNDTPMLPACLITLTFLLAVYFAKNGYTTLKLFLIGVIQLFSIYFHQSNVIFLTLMPVSLLLAQTYNGRIIRLSRKLRIIFLYLFLMVAILTLSYLIAGFLIVERDLTSSGQQNFANWLFLYATLDRWGLSHEKKDYIIHFYRGIGDAFLNFQGINNLLRVDFSKKLSLENAPYNFNVIFWFGIFSLSILNLKSMVKKYQTELIIFVFWFIPSIIFYTWWQGYFFEFWVSTSIALWLYSFWTLDSLPLALFSHTQRALMNIIYLFMIFLLFAVNFPYATLPRSEKIFIGNIGDLEAYRASTLRLSREKVYFSNK